MYVIQYIEFLNCLIFLFVLFWSWNCLIIQYFNLMNKHIYYRTDTAMKRIPTYCEIIQHLGYVNNCRTEKIPSSLFNNSGLILKNITILMIYFLEYSPCLFLSCISRMLVSVKVIAYFYFVFVIYDNSCFEWQDFEFIVQLWENVFIIYLNISKYLIKTY